ncbi:hypothetical protein H2248_007644 [Termitomyces sp. 'cryptogamus']|nr:hypothetical protein H2248_007644 [Termitomyces sp. 'cryptogamus']
MIRTKACFSVLHRLQSPSSRSFSFSPSAPFAMKYITRDELADVIKTSIPKKDFVIVDVRDDDFRGGNIKGAINKPSRDFLTSVDELIKDTKDIPLVIFHCALSQVRGPKAARIYEETRRNVLYGKDIPHEVAVLREGFARFQEKYRDDPDLIENWDKEIWSSEWS